MPTCIVCGKKNATTHKLPHGDLSFCNYSCFEKVIVATQKAVPILWVGQDDYLDRELIDSEEFKDQDKALIAAAMEVQNGVLNDSFWDGYSDCLVDSVDEFEKEMIRNTPMKELPLLIGHLKHGNDEFLTRRFKGIKE